MKITLSSSDLLTLSLAKRKSPARSDSCFRILPAGPGHAGQRDTTAKTGQRRRSESCNATRSQFTVLAPRRFAVVMEWQRQGKGNTRIISANLNVLLTPEQNKRDFIEATCLPAAANRRQSRFEGEDATKRSRLFPSRIDVFAKIVFATLSAQAREKDVVEMKNGDQLTGAVKKLENWVFYFDTEYSSAKTSLDWLEVDILKTAVTFQVLLRNGQRIVGSIEKVRAVEAPRKDFVVHGTTAEIRVDSMDVVYIESQKPTFWRQLRGSIDAGFNFTSGNGQGTLNFDGTASYDTRKWMTNNGYAWSISGQSGASKANTIALQTLDGIFLKRNSFLGGLGHLLHSLEQSLALRTTLGGGYGHYFV